MTRTSSTTCSEFAVIERDNTQSGPAVLLVVARRSVVIIGRSRGSPDELHELTWTPRGVVSVGGGSGVGRRILAACRVARRSIVTAAVTDVLGDPFERVLARERHREENKHLAGDVHKLPLAIRDGLSMMRSRTHSH